MLNWLRRAVTRYRIGLNVRLEERRRNRDIAELKRLREMYPWA